MGSQAAGSSWLRAYGFGGANAVAGVGAGGPGLDARVELGLGAALAGCAGVLMALIFPISPLTSTAYLGKAFVVCVLGGLGSVSGALAGGILLALIEGIGSTLIGPAHATTLSFVLLIIFLIVRPQGLLGRKGFE